MPSLAFFTRSKLLSRDKRRKIRVASPTYALLQSAVGHPALPHKVVK